MPDAALGHEVGVATLAARVAAQLARDTPRSCEDVSRDAVAIAMAAMDARAARCMSRLDEYGKAIARLVHTAERYGAAVIEANDPSGMIVGLEFAPSTTHRSGHQRNWFYLA